MKSSLPLYARSAILRALLFIAVVTAITSYALWREREQALLFARKSAAATVALMEQHTVTTFRVVELALAETAGTLSLRSFARHDATIRDAMRGRLKDMPYVRAMYVIGPDGFLQHDTDYPATPDVSLADRDYFRAYVADPALVTGMSAPLLSRSGTGWFVAMTRRVGPPGQLQGVAVAAIQLRYFADLYKRMELGEGQRIALYHLDGRLMAQYPEDDSQMGHSFAETELFREQVPRGASGEYVAHELPHGDARIITWRRVQGEPLIVVLSQDLHAVLSPWRRTALGAAVAIVALMILTAMAVRLYNRNASERKRARERMAQGEKLEAIGRLTGSVAHDFGNVLGIVNNNLAILERLPAAEDGRVRQSLDVLQRAVATGTQLTRDLMSFARKRELKLETVDLGEALHDMLPILQQAGGRTRVELEKPAALHRCSIDRTQLQVAMINLVVNARDAMDGAGRIVISTFNAMRPDANRPALFSRGPLSEWVGITVADTGVGMTEEVRSRALEPFFSTKGEQGTGLGLAQVYGFVRQLGGEIAIESAPGQGTKMHLYFPAVTAAAAPNL